LVLLRTDWEQVFGSFESRDRFAMHDTLARWVDP
jgi:hypothetical protein